MRRCMPCLVARTSPRRCQRPGAGAGKSPVPPGKNREPARQSQARPKKSRAPRKRSQPWLCRVPRSAGKESRLDEKESGSDEKKPREALWSVGRGTESVVVGTARSRVWHFGTKTVPDTFSRLSPSVSGVPSLEASLSPPYIPVLPKSWRCISSYIQ